VGPWIDGMILKNSFSHLFCLVVNKMSTVAEMFSLGWEEDGETWKWRRRLLASLGGRKSQGVLWNINQYCFAA